LQEFRVDIIETIFFHIKYKFKYTQESGILSYYEICDNLNEGWTKSRSEEQRVPYAYSNSEWIGFDDQESLREKV
jgi:chitinase